MNPYLIRRPIGVNDDCVYLGCFDFEINFKKIKDLSNWNDRIRTYIIPSQDNADHPRPCIAIRTGNIRDDLIRTTYRMSALAWENFNCTNPSLCFTMWWHRNDNPNLSDILDTAEHCIKALGMSHHLYFITVHRHFFGGLCCNVVINRLHPITYKIKRIRGINAKLDYAARECEIKFGWKPDEYGLHQVVVDSDNQKVIIPARSANDDKNQS